MKFLIDECLHTSLVGTAHDAGHGCDHVNFLGIGALKDWQLMPIILAEDYTFVTNNRSDFLALYAKQNCMPGWSLSFRMLRHRANANSSKQLCHTSAFGN